MFEELERQFGPGALAKYFTTKRKLVAKERKGYTMDDCVAVWSRAVGKDLLEIRQRLGELILRELQVGDVVADDADAVEGLRRVGMRGERRDADRESLLEALHRSGPIAEIGLRSVASDHRKRVRRQERRMRLRPRESPAMCSLRKSSIGRARHPTASIS